MTANKRPCGACRHLDTRQLLSGAQYCWARYIWSRSDAVVADCDKAERADGNAPPGRIWFRGERT